jgi:hypothetical protein
MGMTDCNPASLPILSRTVIKIIDEDILFIRNNIMVYQQIIGSTIYLLNYTRSDIAYIVGQLARFMLKPAISYLKLYKQLLRYLKGIIKVGITYSNRRGKLPQLYSIYFNTTWDME